MKKANAFFLAVLLASLLATAYTTRNVNATPTTINYGNLTLTPPGVWAVMATHWNDVWDLTKGDLTLSYTIDMSHVAQPAAWDTSYTEVGLRTEGASDFNPGPFGHYQGGCGGWMTSLYGDLTPNNNNLNNNDKHNLGASGGEGEGDYDCLVPGTVIAHFGSGNNYGIWFDRDGVDPWQDDDPLTPVPWGSSVPWGSHNGLTYNTGGIYQIVIQYHEITPNLGSMFATVNGQPTGFYTPAYHDGVPDYYPAGLSFMGDMTRMQVFAGIIAPGGVAQYGFTVVNNLTVTGELGATSPLVADFTYSPIPPVAGSAVQFTDTTHGGYVPYSSWSWDFGDGTPVSIVQNPSHVYTASGDYDVKLTVKGYCPNCGSATVTKTIHVYAYYLTVNVDPSGLTTILGQGWYDAGATPTLTAPQFMTTPFLYWDVDGVSQGNTVNPITVTMDANHTATAHYYVPGVGGEWAPVNTVELVTPWIAFALLALASAVALSHRLLKKRW